jgi:AcrR family transcriptional regulator
VPPTTPKRAAVQADVLRATEQLLAEGTSWSDLGVEKIATTAGISRTAFYFYFRDKRDLLMQLAGDVSDLLYQQADIWWHGEGDPEEDIREALGNIAALYREHGTLLRAIVELATYDAEVAAFWRSLLDRYVAATQRRIEAEQAAGNAPAMPARAVAFALTWMAERTIYQEFVQDETLPLDDLIEAMAGIHTRAVYGRV